MGWVHWVGEAAMAGWEARVEEEVLAEHSEEAVTAGTRAVGLPAVLAAEGMEVETVAKVGVAPAGVVRVGAKVRRLHCPRRRHNLGNRSWDRIRPDCRRRY